VEGLREVKLLDFSCDLDFVGLEGEEEYLYFGLLGEKASVGNFALGLHSYLIVDIYEMDAISDFEMFA
jgi:hypothetical protein